MASEHRAEGRADRTARLRLLRVEDEAGARGAQGGGECWCLNAYAASWDASRNPARRLKEESTTTTMYLAAQEQQPLLERREGLRQLSRVGML